MPSAPRITNEKRQTVIDAYRRHSTIAHIAKITGLKSKQITSIIDDHGITSDERYSLQARCIDDITYLGHQIDITNVDGITYTIDDMRVVQRIVPKYTAASQFAAGVPIKQIATSIRRTPDTTRTYIKTMLADPDSQNPVQRARNERDVHLMSLYTQGRTQKDIAQELGMSPERVRQILRANGVKPLHEQRLDYPAQTIDEAVEDYINNVHTELIMECYDIDRPTLRAWVVSRGLESFADTASPVPVRAPDHAA